MTKEQTFGPKEPQGIGVKGVKMGSRRSTTRHPLFAPTPFYLPHRFRLFPSTSSPLSPLSPFQLAQKCAPTPPQVQKPALKCARPFSGGFKMRAACAPRCANFPKNPISRVKNRLLPFSAPCVGSGDSDLFLLKKVAFSFPSDTMAPVAAHFWRGQK